VPSWLLIERTTTNAFSIVVVLLDAMVGLELVATRLHLLLSVYA
jgi:hypothetical protein